MKRALSTLLAFAALSISGTVSAQDQAADPARTAYEKALADYRTAQAAWDNGQAVHLEWNARRRGWHTTPSGLQYRLIGRTNPKGTQPVETDTVKVHYRGTLINGTEFDSSYSRNEPAAFPLNRVIKGWTEGVALMREGETYEFLIPADLAYGARRVGEDIPANSALYFTVELLEVNP